MNQTHTKPTEQILISSVTRRRLAAQTHLVITSGYGRVRFLIRFVDSYERVGAPGIDQKSVYSMFPLVKLRSDKRFIILGSAYTSFRAFLSGRRRYNRCLGRLIGRRRSDDERRRGNRLSLDLGKRLRALGRAQ